ncbi:MAG TPA: MFS transporter [Sedimentisphaerales bacterium]|nr:MFS transporter [Sedimentisphaerales bacterium]
MGKTFAQIAALLFSAAILLMGNGLQVTLLPLRAQVEAFSTVQIGLIGSAYYVGFAAGCFWGPHLVKRVGHIRTFTAMVAIASAAPLIHSIWLSAEIWWVLRAASGFCLATLYMIIESWLNEKATNQNRGTVFSAYTIISLTVVILGQLMINFSTVESFILFSVASVLVSLAAVPLSLSQATAPAQVQTVRIRLLYLFRLSPVGVVGAFLVGIQQGAFWSLGPVFADRIGLDTLAITLFMSSAVLGGALGQWPLGKLSDRIDRRKVLIGASIAAAAVSITIRYVYPTLGEGVMLLTLIWGLMAFPLYSICAAHMNDHVKEGGFLEASSGLLLIFAAGAILGPLIISPFMTLKTPYALFGWIAAFQLLLVVFTVWRMAVRERVPDSERNEFVESLNEIQRVYHSNGSSEKGRSENTGPENHE